MTSSATARSAAPALPIWLAPADWVGKIVIGALAYFGGVAVLLFSAAASTVSVDRDEDSPAFWSTMKRELAWLLVMGIPLVGLVHVGIGSSLSLQAYFGSTFVDGTGAVVGVGLLRNVASIATGMAVAGLIAYRMIPLVGSEVIGVLPRGRAGRLAAPRLAAATLAMVMLSHWGFLVGTFIGWRAAGTMMGLSSNMFFLMFYQMIWFRDVVGLIVKGLLFGLVGAAIACHEGLRVGRPSPRQYQEPVETGPGLHAQAADLDGAIVRATCVSIIAMLLLNMTWFMLIYHAVPVYGPSLLQPPTP
jgi:phospholipid/cholesterol/gamma-HCH transport system permease protein